MLRDEIQEHLKWDLSGLFKNYDEFKNSVLKCEELIEKIKDMKGSLCISITSFTSYMDTNEALDRLLDNVYVYAHSLSDVEPSVEENQLMLAQGDALVNKKAVALNFVDLELIKGRKQIEAYLKDDKCKDYRYPMSELYRYVDHFLDEQSEELLANYSDIEANAAKIFASLRLEFPDVEVDGKKEFLNAATLRCFLENSDSKVRQEAFEKYYSEYKRYDNAFCNMLVGNAKGQVLQAKIRKYDSALEASLFSDGVNKTLFDKVLDMANRKYISFFHEYNALKKEVLGLDVLHFYDLNVPLVASIDKKYSVKECIDILKQSLAPLKEDYVEMLDVAIRDRWIDFMPHLGKRSGAYSSGSYDSNPFILTSFTGSYNDVSTIAHEFGHSMHSYYSKQNNRPLLANYKIFVAEVASTVNEVLLNAYLVKNCADKEFKKYLLYNFMEQLVGTLYRQPMFADFEVFLHEQLEKGESLSSSVLTSYYLKSSVDYFGSAVEVDELVKYQIYAVPHFYYNFYVYKYTLGMAVALHFATQILKGEVGAYRTFLTKGGSESPLDELLNAGVDPCVDQVYDSAFNYFNELLNEFKSLLK